MKSYTITEDQLQLLVSKIGLKDLGEILPNILPKKLEIGEWYKNIHIPTTIINCQVFEDNIKSGYGIHMGMWSDSWGLLNHEDYVKATDEEVMEILIDYAKKRGYKRGVEIYTFRGARYLIDHSEIYYWKHPTETLTIGVDDFSIYSNGRWASIIINE